MNSPQKQIIKMFEKGILLNEGMLNKEIDETTLLQLENEEDLLVLNEDYINILHYNLIDWYEIDYYKVLAEKERDEQLYQTQLNQFKKITLITKTPPFSQIQEVFNSIQKGGSFEEKLDLFHQSDITNEVNSKSSHLLDLTSHHILSTTLIQKSYPINIINLPLKIVKKFEVKDFSHIFLTRYHFLENILRNRQELKYISTISRILNKKERENVSLIGIIAELGETKKGNLILTVEDPTGRIKIIISKENKNLFSLAKDLVLDEVIGLVGTNAEKIIFAEEIIWPDISHSELKKSDADENVIFLSDIHIGSKFFLKNEFERFLQWINGNMGNEEQREIAHKVKYIFIAGDIVDGVGIYPSHEEESEIKDIFKQYHEFCRMIKQIPQDKQIIICPGNHDVVHLAEPQPIFYKEYSPELFNLPNITLVTNPALINIGKKINFSGFDVLMYHGFSFDYYVSKVESIRNGGGYHRADLIMKFLLKRRHLAPSFKSTPYFPCSEEDPLLIKQVPDFFVSGHIHYSSVANYKGVTMISGSCWQSKTSFQEKMGHEPEPARIPLVNLKTRKIRILKFM